MAAVIGLALLGWVTVALLVAAAIGRAVRLADDRSPDAHGSPPLTTADLPPGFRAQAGFPLGHDPRRG